MNSNNPALAACFNEPFAAVSRYTGDAPSAPHDFGVGVFYILLSPDEPRLIAAAHAIDRILSTGACRPGTYQLPATPHWLTLPTTAVQSRIGSGRI
jgi:hypothetical protein